MIDAFWFALNSSPCLVVLLFFSCDIFIFSLYLAFSYFSFPHFVPHLLPLYLMSVLSSLSSFSFTFSSALPPHLLFPGFLLGQLSLVSSPSSLSHLSLPPYLCSVSSFYDLTPPSFFLALYSYLFYPFSILRSSHSLLSTLTILFPLLYLPSTFSFHALSPVLPIILSLFFSLSLGVCVMTTYGSYLKKDTNIPKTAAQVALIDTGVAFIAGLMILPAMFVAKNATPYLVVLICDRNVTEEKCLGILIY